MSLHSSFSWFWFAPLFSLDWQSCDKFVVKVRLVGIKGVRMIFEHIIEKLPNHEVCRTPSYTFRILAKKKSYTFRTEKPRNSVSLSSSATMLCAELCGIVSTHTVTCYFMHLCATSVYSKRYIYITIFDDLFLMAANSGGKGNSCLPEQRLLSYPYSSWTVGQDAALLIRGQQRVKWRR